MCDIVLADIEFACNLIKGERFFKVTLYIRQDALEKRQFITAGALMLIVIDDPVDGEDEITQFIHETKALCTLLLTA